MTEMEKSFGYVFATKKLVENKLPVGFMYRESATNGDSGWRFFSGDEDQGYVDNPDNIGIYAIKRITEIDAAIIPYLNAPVGTAFERVSATNVFQESVGYNFTPEGDEV